MLHHILTFLDDSLPFYISPRATELFHELIYRLVISKAMRSFTTTVLTSKACDYFTKHSEIITIRLHDASQKLKQLYSVYKLANDDDGDDTSNPENNDELFLGGFENNPVKAFQLEQITIAKEYLNCALMSATWFIKVFYFIFAIYQCNFRHYPK